MSNIQINTKEDLKETADEVVLNIVYNLSKADSSNKDIQTVMSYIKTTCGNEAYLSMKDGFAKLLEENIVGIKAFKADLINFLMSNEGKQFEITITEKNENNSI